jgi:fibronectin-binding autotransporter adhesin
MHPVLSCLRLLACVALAVFAAAPLQAQRQMEKLGRGLIAHRISSTQVYVGWRLLGNDIEDVAFNLYRSANGGAAVKLNGAPITASTNYLDTPPNLAGESYTYSVKAVLNGTEVTDTWAHPLSASVTLAANTPAVAFPYIRVPLQPTPDGALSIKFCWVGDLDGDGEYDFVVDRQPSGDARQFLEAYKRDGTLLWRMNLGPNSVNHYNIEPGSSTISIGHGDNATVYDMDGDGKAEVLLRTANGVVFGDGATLSHGDDRVQFLSVINGLTGAELARAQIPNPWLSDGQMNGHMGILYADGLRPSVMWHSTNRRDTGGGDNGFNGIVTTWDYRNGALTQRWSRNFNTLTHEAAGHQIRIGDPDNDGKDEYLDVGHGLDDDGTQLYGNPEIVHGDRFHVGDIDPDRPGLETYVIQQNNGTGLATALYESDTGKTIKKWYAGGVVDVGRGSAADFDPAHKGYELVSTQPGIFNAKGVQIYPNAFFPAENIWWDADLSREYLQSSETVRISKVNNGILSFFDLMDQTTPAPGAYLADGGRPAFWGDIVGDWREEMVVPENGNAALRIYTTPRIAANRIYTLMHNPQYRTQATTKGYVQASIVDYYLGTGMTPPPPPPMVDADLIWRGDAGASTWDAGVTSAWRASATGANSTFANGSSVRFDLAGGGATAVALNGTVSPGAVTVYSPTDYTLSGGGLIAGSATLTKAGAGTLTLAGSHSFSGRTTIWDGALLVNGTLSQSPVTIWGGTWGGAGAAGLEGGRLGGTGQINQPVSLKYRGAIVPGNGSGSAGTLTLAGGLTADDGSVLALELSDDPSGSTKPNDRIVVTGDLTLSGTVTVAIKALNAQLAPGTYTLLTYSGALNGGAANLAVHVPVGTPYTLAAAGGAITLTVPVTRAPAPVVWRGTGGTWDVATSQNWLRSGLPDIFVGGDAVTFDATGSAAPAVTLATALPVASLTVNSATNYSFSGVGSITGTGGITKSGTGTLTINTTNDYTGPTVINAGVLAIDNLNNAGEPSSLGATTADASNLVLNGGTLRLIGTQTNTDRNLTLGAAGGTLDVAAGSSAMQISGTVIGPGGLTKTGAGTLLLAGANTYAGGTTLSAGTLYLAGITANVSGLGSGAVTFDGGTLTMADVQGSENAAWNIIVPAGKSGRLNADGRCTLSGTLTGSGDFTLFSGFVRTELAGDWSAFTGRVFFVTDADGGDMRFRNLAGIPLAELNLAANTFTYYAATLASDSTLPVGALSGNAAARLLGSSTGGRTLTWAIGNKNIDTTFPGIIANGAGITALQKVGTGTLTLTGANTYTGATTVSAGTLLVNGTSSSSPFTVESGGTLGGSGVITGPVSFLSGSKMLLGNGPITVSGNVTLSGALTVVSPVPRADGTYTVLSGANISGTPTLSYSGPLAAGQVANFSVAGTTVTLTLSNIFGRSPAAITWTGAISNVWDGSIKNWQVNLDSSATNFITGDTVNFTDAFSAAPTINLAANVEPFAVVFSNNTTPFVINSSASGRIGGAATLTKSGTGFATLNGDNTYTGATTVTAGTLAINGASSSSSFVVQSGGALGGNTTLAVPVTFQTGGRLLVTPAGSLKTTGALTLPSAMTVTAGTYVPDGTYTALEASTLPSATWSYSGPLFIGQSASVSVAANKVMVTFSGTVSTRVAQAVTWSGATSGAWTTAVANNWKVVADGTATSFLPNDAVIFDDTLTANPTIAAASAVFPASVTFANNTAPYRINSSNGGISGPITLVKNGTGTALLSGANNYTGGTIVNDGILALADDAANNGGTGTGLITLNGGTFRYNNSTGQSNGAPQNFFVPAGASARIIGDGRSGLTGTLTGAGTLEFVTNFIRLDAGGNWSQFTGRINVTSPSTGEFRLGNNAGMANAHVDLGNGVTFYWTPSLSANLTYGLGALSGSATNAVLGGSSTGARTLIWSIGSRNIDTTFAGRITNSGGPAALTKVGSGRLTLQGANTYTGATIVMAGTLDLPGSITNTGTVEVRSGATLHLTGTLTTGTLTIRAGGRLTGGGTINANVVNEGLIEPTGGAAFTLAGNLTNAATGVIRLKKGAGFTQNSGTFTNNGVLDLITAGPTNLVQAAGTKVLDQYSVMTTSLVWTPGNPAELTMFAYDGHTFQLQRTTDLVAGPWVNIGAPVNGTGAPYVFTDPAPPATGKFFYRVVVDL